MRKTVIAALGALTLTAGAAAAQVTSCRDVDCSGRHIECGGKMPWDKLACEADKAKWKAACEVSKAPCTKLEEILK